MREKKPTHKEIQKKGKQELELLMKRIEKEREMIDDHGPVVIGQRDRQPQLENIDELE